MGIYKIINSSNNDKPAYVKFVKTELALTQYFASEHPALKGFSRDTLRKKLKNVGDIYDKGDFAIIYTSEDDFRKVPKRITKNKKVELATDIPVFGNRTEDVIYNGIKYNKFVGIEKMTYKNILSVYNTDDLIKYIMDIINEYGRLHNVSSVYKVILESIDNLDEKRIIATKYLNVNDLFFNLVERFEAYKGNYGDVPDIKSITINRVKLSNRENDFMNNLVFGSSTKNLLNEFIIKNIKNDRFKNYLNKINNLSESYVIVCPKTSKACLIKAFIISYYKTIDDDKVYKYYDTFIKNNQEFKNTESFEQESTIMKLCKYYMVRCKTYNLLDNEIYEQNYKFDDDETNEQVELMIFARHSYAMIKRIDNINKIESDVLVNATTQKAEQLIESIDYSEKDLEMKDYKICTYDFETCSKKDSNETMIYAAGFCDGSKKFTYDKYLRIIKDSKGEPITNYEYDEMFKTDESDMSVNFINWLLSTYCKRNKTAKKLILYGHNAGKFDCYLIINALLNHKSCVVTNILISNSRILNLKVTYFGHTIYFRDSYSFIQCSLDDACESFQTSIKKMTGVYDHNLINHENCMTKEIHNKCSPYMKNDVIGLYEVLDKFNKKMIQYFNVDIKNVMTNASIARRVFMQKYYDPVNQSIYTIESSINDKLRNYYYGGRNEIFNKLGYQKGKFYYFDFTSHYPNQMKTQNFGVGKLSTKITNVYNNEFGFIEASVKHSQDYINKPTCRAFHGIKKNGKLIFPTIKNAVSLIITTEEYNYSIKNNLGYEYDIKTIYYYDRYEKIFDKIISDVYNLKNDADKAGDSVLRDISKIIINSLYGFWGIDTNNRQSIKIKEQSDSNKTEATFYKYIESSKLIDYKRIGKYDVYELEESIECVANLGIAFMTTSYARTALYDVIYNIEKSRGHVYYCDTDSIITDYNIKNDVYFSKQCINKGEDLGGLKNELGNDKYYEEIIMMCNKTYACRNQTLMNELKAKKDISKSEKKILKKCLVMKFKGYDIKKKYINKDIVVSNDINNMTVDIVYSKLDNINGLYNMTFDDFKIMTMNKNYNIKFESLQFISGKSVIMNEIDIIKRENVKTFSMIYEKAIIENNNIYQLII